MEMLLLCSTGPSIWSERAHARADARLRWTRGGACDLVEAAPLVCGRRRGAGSEFGGGQRPSAQEVRIRARGRGGKGPGEAEAHEECNGMVREAGGGRE